MEMFYEKLEATRKGREEILKVYPEIRDLPTELQKKTVDLFFSAWKASGVEKLKDLRFSQHMDYPLHLHIRETVQTGMSLYRFAMEHWDDSWTEKEIAHGVLGAMMARDFGLDERVISLIACHSPKSPVHPGNAMMQILHYADLFSADHILLNEGRKAFFQ